MIELAPTLPDLRRLFQTIDLALFPQHGTVSESLNAWRRARGRSLVPGRVQVGKELSRSTLSSSLIAEQPHCGSDLQLCSIGEAFCQTTGLDENSRHLKDMEEARVAARLRRLFRLALTRGEPVIGRFTEGTRSYEVLAAPISLDSGRLGVWCTLAAQEPAFAGGR